MQGPSVKEYTVMRMPRNMLDFNSYLSGLMGGMVEGPQLISSGHLASRGMLSCGTSGGELCFFFEGEVYKPHTAKIHLEPLVRSPTIRAMFFQIAYLT